MVPPILFVLIVLLAMYLGFIIGRSFKATDQWNAGFQCAKDIYKRRLNEIEIAAAQRALNVVNGSANNGRKN
jgi:hypothetical protein